MAKNYLIECLKRLAVEDVTEIILNVKELALAIHSDGEKTLVIDSDISGLQQIEE